MKNRKWVQFMILSVALLAGVYTVGAGIFKQDDKSVKVGSYAPEFSLQGLDGKVYNLSDYKGSSVVVNFWGTFCPPCVNEMPALERQYDKWKKDDVVVLGLNLNESPITVRSFLDRHNITFPILMDQDEVRKQYKVVSYPTTFYINSEGIIENIFIGEMQESDIDSRIGKLVTLQ